MNREEFERRAAQDLKERQARAADGRAKTAIVQGVGAAAAALLVGLVYESWLAVTLVLAISAVLIWRRYKDAVPSSDSNINLSSEAASDGRVKILQKSEVAGIGCALQGLGLLFIWFWPFGTIVGVGLLIFGSMKSKFLACGKCGNRITDRDVRMCPVCKSPLER